MLLEVCDDGGPPEGTEDTEQTEEGVDLVGGGDDVGGTEGDTEA